MDPPEAPIKVETTVKTPYPENRRALGLALEEDATGVRVRTFIHRIHAWPSVRNVARVAHLITFLRPVTQRERPQMEKSIYTYTARVGTASPNAHMTFQDEAGHVLEWESVPDSGATDRMLIQGPSGGPGSKSTVNHL